MTKEEKERFMKHFYYSLEEVDKIDTMRDYYILYGICFNSYFAILTFMPEYASDNKVSLSYIDRVFEKKKGEIKNDL